MVHEVYFNAAFHEHPSHKAHDISRVRPHPVGQPSNRRGLSPTWFVSTHSDVTASGVYLMHLAYLVRTPPRNETCAFDLQPQPSESGPHAGQATRFPRVPASPGHARAFDLSAHPRHPADVHPSRRDDRGPDERAGRSHVEERRDDCRSGRTSGRCSSAMAAVVRVEVASRSCTNIRSASSDVKIARPYCASQDC
jgi:hypothetical protein